MNDIKVARYDFGLATCQVRERIPGKRGKYRKVEAVFWKERLDVTVNGKVFQRWVNVPYLKNDHDPAGRRATALVKAWRELADRVFIEAMEGKR